MFRRKFTVLLLVGMFPLHRLDSGLPILYNCIWCINCDYLGIWQRDDHLRRPHRRVYRKEDYLRLSGQVPKAKDSRPNYHRTVLPYQLLPLCLHLYIISNWQYALQTRIRKLLFWGNNWSLELLFVWRMFVLHVCFNPHNLIDLCIQHMIFLTSPLAKDCCEKSNIYIYFVCRYFFSAILARFDNFESIFV